MMSILWTAIRTLTICVVILLVIDEVYCEAKTMTVTEGMLSGTVMDGVVRYLGIPYAKPPVGNLRFKPPLTPDNWSNVRDANKPANSCWQPIDTNFDQFSGVNMWNPNTPRSEDCLYLNVWAPITDAAPRPIMVWIYGGGFWAGTSTLDVYDPTKLVVIGDVVVVSFNYRLGPFGFLYSGESDAPGNVGMLDQVMALEWVKANAGNIGGDPEKITLFGESAGAASIGYHMLSPLSKDLFTNSIMMSASPFVTWGVKDKNEAIERYKMFADKVGCTRLTDSAITACLRQVDASLLTNTQWDVINDVYLDTPFALITGDTFLPQSVSDLMSQNKIKKTSVLTGVVKDEGIYWLLYGFTDVFKRQDPNPVDESHYHKVLGGILKQQGSYINSNLTSFIYRDSCPPRQRPSNLDVLDDMSGDTLFKCAVRNFAAEYSAISNTNTYVYSFEHRLDSITWPQYMGVPHGYEIEAFLGLPFLHPSNYSYADREVSGRAINYIAQFAKTGNPNADGNSDAVNWPRFTPNTEEYLVINTTISTDNALRYRECKFWKEGASFVDTEEGSASLNRVGTVTSFPAIAIMMALCAVLVWSGSVLPC